MGIRVLLTLSQMGNEGGDVLFEFGQVHGHIVFIELSLLIVLLVSGDGKLESRVIELRDHAPDIVTDADHLVLNIADLALLSFDLVSALINFILEVALGFFLLLAGHGVNLGVALKLSLNVAVLLLDHVDFTVKNIHVVEKRNVLLFSLDECGNDFVDGSDTGGLLDLFEGILDNLDVTDVHVHQVLLLLVVVDNLIKTDLEEDSGVGEISHSVSAFLAAHVLSARLLSLILILLLQFLLKVEDTVLEVELVHIVLSLKGKDLVLGLLRESGASLSEVVELLDALDDATNLLVEAIVDLVLNSLLLTGSINLLLKRLVATLKVVVGVEGLVELVFLQFDLVAVTLDHNLLDLILLNSLVDSVLFAGLEGWELIEAVGPRRHVVTIKRDTKSFTDIWVVDLGHTSSLLLFELFLGSLDLSSEYHKAFLLMLELLSEAVSLALKALSLRLVHSGLAHTRALTVGVGCVHSDVYLQRVFN